MRIGEGDIVVLVAGELDDGRRKAIEQVTGADRVLEHVVGATVDQDMPDTGGVHTIVGLRVAE